MKIPGIPTCKEVFDHRYDMEEQGFMKKMMMKMHISMCKNCQNFQALMGGLEDKMKQSMKASADKANPEEIESLKKQIKEKIIK
jgi:predicted anti-sigma-YlaC factor YlaD